MLICHKGVTSEHVILFYLDVSIPLGEIVTLQNDTLSEMVKALLQNIKIPLDKVRVDPSL